MPFQSNVFVISLNVNIHVISITNLTPNVSKSSTNKFLIKMCELVMLSLLVAFGQTIEQSFFYIFTAIGFIIC
jgi:hypothetical protein